MTIATKSDRDLIVELGRNVEAYARVTNRRVDDLAFEQEKIREDIGEIRTDVSSLKAGQAELKADVSELKVRVGSVETKVDTLTDVMNENFRILFTMLKKD